MDLFLQQHDKSVTGILRGWDRLRFRGTQRMLSHVQGLNRFLQCTRRLIKDFGDFAQQASRQIRAASLEVAELADRPVIHLDSPKINKEPVALDIAKRDGIKQGLVAAITAVESCQSFDVRSVQSEAGKKLLEHSVNHNSVKMYNKAGSVLRVETTLNDMRDMRAARQVEGKTVWRPMRKGVADLPRRAEVSDAANRRYIEALAAVETPLPLKDLTGKLSDRVKFKNQHVRGLNLLGTDSQLLRAIGGGEFLINGFRNRDVQAALFRTPADDPAIKRKRSGQVTRKLRLLRAHGLIQKVPHTHRYLVSSKGRQVIVAIHAAAEADIQKLTAAA